ncbi:MAG: 2,3-bisphosphoglycerate-independent phosphoglycerate mutase, partial [Gammaproteobacteria bacterium]|nr:2,3-bisphosphoglycerate-independent phosphoglycerate mutase [Gammaproteobacteria bacterium]
TLHFMGLHSDGNVHSHNNHLYQLMYKAAEQGVRSCCLHILLDGRDVSARSALSYIEKTEAVISEINDRYNADFRIASGGGRMHITMDRYEADWSMVKRGYDCHTHGIGQQFESAAEAVTALYESSGKDDQYLPEFVIVRGDEATGRMQDGDAIIFYNFRGDRAIEISLAYERDDFSEFNREEFGPHPNVFYAGMLQYDGDELIPQRYLVNPPEIDRTMGEYLCAEGVRSFAVSETQKFGHVTFFWNGNRSGYLDEALETYIEVPSDNIEFNQAPEMKAREITTETIRLIESGEYRFGRINLANGDMVGHTGDLAAAITAMEVVDDCVAQLIEAVIAADGILLFTADHGNADIMFTEKDGVRVAKTSHTLSPVPFAIVDAAYAGEYTMQPPEDAGLTHIAATALNLLGYQEPQGYQPGLLSFTES